MRNKTSKRNVYLCKYPDPHACVQFNEKRCVCRNPNVKCSYRKQK